MFNKILVSTALLAALVAPLAASAGEVQNRIDTQQHRINQGVRSGSLTNGETNRLQRSENRIQAERNYDLRRNDGHLTAGERVRLNRQENRVSARIYDDKHNAWNHR
ncbi:MAG TPA: hypothetical protein VMA36_09450 [Candidatus Limnocylindria bacterium]|jgi:hypothetical protein|nr:hypothetical protein [Candidatus Limnocylindria bacterium]